MSRPRKGKELRLRFDFGPQPATPVRRYVLDLKSGETRGIEPVEAQSLPPSEDFTVVELEKARLRDMARRLEHPASTPAMRERGEALLEELAQRLARGQVSVIVGSENSRRARQKVKDEAKQQALASVRTWASTALRPRERGSLPENEIIRRYLQAVRPPRRDAERLRDIAGLRRKRKLKSSK